jgi:hypothetical protein
MDIYKLYEEKFSYNGIGNIICELGLRDAKFIFTDPKPDEPEYGSTLLGRTMIIGIDYEDLGDERYNFNIKYENVVKIYLSHISNFIDDICTILSKSNEEVNSLLKIACIENTIVHELKHLNQYKTTKLTLDNVDMQVDDENKTYGFSLNKHTEFIFERDANMYMLSKKYDTFLEDKKLKKYLARIECNNFAYFNITRYLETPNLDPVTIEENKNIQNLYAEMLQKWVGLLDNHIKNKY